MTEYTLTFDQEHEGTFNSILNRLDPEEFTVIKELHKEDEDKGRHSKLAAILEMDDFTALTFKMGMKEVVLSRPKSDEEIARDKANKERNRVTITVQTNQL